MTSTLDGVVPSIIDAHIHQWDPFTTPREASRLAPLYRRAPGLLERLMPVLLDRGTREMVLTARHAARPYLPADYATDVAEARAAVGVPVEAAVHIQASWEGPDPVDETAWLETLDWGRAGNPRLAAIVGHADPQVPDIASVLDRHAAASPRFRGVRFLTSWHPDKGVKRWIKDDGVLRSADFLRGFAALAERKLVFDAYPYSGQLGDVAVLAREYPETTIVVDHYASPVGVLGPMGRSTARTPSDRAAILAAWRDEIAELAGHPNVVAKHSGLAFPMLGLRERGIGRAQLAELVAPLVDHTTDVFGPDRLVFGSNYPMDKSIATYGTLVGALCDILAPRGPELLAKVFRDNALEVYGEGH